MPWLWLTESDSQNIIRALQGNGWDLAPEGIVYREARMLIRPNFSDVSFHYAPRTCNKVAHALALGCNGHEPSRLWPEGAPDDVRMILASDLAVPAV